MRKVLMIALALLTLGSQMEVAAEKKEKKEKKALKWDWDGQTLSGNEKIDTYIKTIDTLYNKVNSYVDSISKYEMKIKPFEHNGDEYEVAYMIDEEGKMVTRGTVNWQCAQAIIQGTNIVLDMTNAGLLSANAALTLPELKLKAIKFAKYVKGGPAVIAAGTKAIKDVRKKWLSNARRWKDIKVDAIADPKSLNYEGMDDALAEKLDKCAYIRKIAKVSETKQQAKTEGEALASANDVFGGIRGTDVSDKKREEDDNLEFDIDKLYKDAENDA